MAILTDFFDASGTDRRQPVFGIAGYVGRAEKWNRFNNDWRSVLAEFDLPSFHLTDFINGKNRFY